MVHRWHRCVRLCHYLWCQVRWHERPLLPQSQVDLLGYWLWQQWQPFCQWCCWWWEEVRVRGIISPYCVKHFCKTVSILHHIADLLLSARKICLLKLCPLWDRDWRIPCGSLLSPQILEEFNNRPSRMNVGAHHVISHHVIWRHVNLWHI